MLRLKDVPRENMYTVVSYLKRVLMLVQNCSCLPTDIMGLLNNIMVLATYKEFSGFMNLIYFNHN